MKTDNQYYQKIFIDGKKENLPERTGDYNTDIGKWTYNKGSYMNDDDTWIENIEFYFLPVPQSDQTIITNHICPICSKEFIPEVKQSNDKAIIEKLEELVEVLRFWFETDDLADKSQVKRLESELIKLKEGEEEPTLRDELKLFIEIDKLNKEGRRLEAVKLHYDFYKISLKESKRICDERRIKSR
jgi:hypothetical protein